MADLFVFYRSFRDSIREMDEREQLGVLLALCDYALDGVETDLDTPMQRAVFTMAKPLIDASNKNREAGKRGGLKSAKGKKKAEANPLVNPLDNPLVNQQEQEQEARSKHQAQEARSKHYSAAENPPPAPASSSKKKFVPPTLDEVAAYCNERHNHISPSAFIDYYEARGWRYGTGKPMVNWKAAVRTWEQKDKERARTQDGPPGETAAEANARIFDELFGGDRHDR